MFVHNAISIARQEEQDKSENGIPQGKKYRKEIQKKRDKKEIIEKRDREIEIRKRKRYKKEIEKRKGQRRHVKV
ncbi:MAG: hypothetical protein V8S27_09480 [Lachnospiraceae bacterium]